MQLVISSLLHPHRGDVLPGSAGRAPGPVPVAVPYGSHTEGLGWCGGATRKQHLTAEREESEKSANCNYKLLFFLI